MNPAGWNVDTLKSILIGELFLLACGITMATVSIQHPVADPPPAAPIEIHHECRDCEWVMDDPATA